MTRDKRRAVTFLAALGGMVTVLALLASPAGADPGSRTSGGAFAEDGSVASGGAVAINGSVASGDAVAINGSTASGDAVAIDGSTASGCSTAIDLSTASGGECGKAHDDDDGHKRKGHGHEGGGIGGADVTPTARLAFTGSSSATLAALAGLALVLGVLLVNLTSERRRVPSKA